MKELGFDPNSYEVKSFTFEGRTVTYRAFVGLDYCANPQDPIQKLNLFAPEAYYRGESINGYSLHTAPILLLNTVGGYMPGPAEEPGPKQWGGGANTAFYCLAHGYVVASVGVRGRTSGSKSDELFVGGVVRKDEAISDHYTGKAPALIVDMKAAVRYLRHFKDLIPGDTERIVSNGTSAGGALSALTGATGNSADYAEELARIGALEDRDDIFASNCFCPIHNLENADMAYEWQFFGEWTYRRKHRAQKDGKVVMVPVEGELEENEKELSRRLKDRFPAYVNSLGLKAPDGTPLTLESDGSGSFREYIRTLLVESAQREVDSRSSCEGLAKIAVPGAKPEGLDCLTIENGRVTGLDWEGYLRFVGRMKRPPAFDALDMGSPENGEFGTETVNARHFTPFSMERSTAEKPQMAEPELVKMLNPLRYLGRADTARHWRIRHGAADPHTSFAIPTILALSLKNRGYDVDYRLPWALPHSGDYELEELFSWIDSLMQ